MLGEADQNFRGTRGVMILNLVYRYIAIFISHLRMLQIKADGQIVAQSLNVCILIH